MQNGREKRHCKVNIAKKPETHENPITRGARFLPEPKAREAGKKFFNI